MLSVIGGRLTTVRWLVPARLGFLLGARRGRSRGVFLCRTNISPSSRSNEKHMAGWPRLLTGITPMVRAVSLRHWRNVYSTIWAGAFPISGCLPSSAAGRTTRPADTCCDSAGADVRQLGGETPGRMEKLGPFWRTYCLSRDLALPG